jgi:hypothetical protein
VRIVKASLLQFERVTPENGAFAQFLHRGVAELLQETLIVGGGEAGLLSQLAEDGDVLLGDR